MTFGRTEVSERMWNSTPPMANLCPRFTELENTEPFPYPIIDDANRELAVSLNMLDRDEIDAAGLPLTCRAVFVIDPARKLRLSILYPATVGRNFE